MINVIGIKRIIILAVLVVLNIGLASVNYLYFAPDIHKSDRKMRTLRNQLSAVRSDIDKLQIESEQLEEQRDSYELIKSEGFFSNQVRSEAKELLSKIQTESKVIKAIANVKAGVLLDDEDAGKANHKVLLSPIEIEIQAFDDGDVYKYIYLAQRMFPGHLSLDGLEMKRVLDVSSPVLRAIASGANPELVNAKVLFAWRTIIPQDQVLPEGQR